LRKPRISRWIGGECNVIRRSIFSSTQTNLKGKKTMKKLLTAAALLLATSAFAAGAPNLAGKWKIHNIIAGNESDQECTLAVADNKISGSCKTDDKPLQLTGSVDGKKVTWKYDSEYNGAPITLTYTATLEDGDTISGAVEVDPYGVTGEFTATPVKP
jgi:hypothetical protein